MSDQDRISPYNIVEVVDLKEFSISSWSFANGWLCLPSVTASNFNFNTTYLSSVKSQMET